MPTPPPTREAELIARAIRHTLESPNEVDSNYENANVVDGLFAIARAIRKLADAVEAATPKDQPR